MKENIIKKIWKDPVWSKIIAALFLSIIAYVWSRIENLTFADFLQKTKDVLSFEVKLEVWLILIITTFLTVIYYRHKRGGANSEEKLTSKKVIETEKEETFTNTPTTAFFEERFCDAFPGLQWEHKVFTSKRDIKNRLTTLLTEPLHFDKANGHGAETRPIWWFKGRGALPIEKFIQLSKNKYLMNNDELIIEKIIAVKGSSYFRSFVYVQCKGDLSTGLYEHYQLNLEAEEERGGEYTEEFAIFRNDFIKREEYDDGSTIIRGKPVKTTGAELRVRSLIRHNFIICAKYAPYNCPDFSKESQPYFKQLLHNEISFDTFTNWMTKFPKNPLDN